MTTRKILVVVKIKEMNRHRNPHVCKRTVRWLQLLHRLYSTGQFAVSVETALTVLIALRSFFLFRNVNSELWKLNKEH